jgi:hypothetical protein
MAEIARRAFGPDAAPEERAAIAARVSVIGDQLLLVHEIPVQTPFSVGIMCDRIEALAAGWERFAYVLDVRESSRPDAETRAALRARIRRISARLAIVSAVVGGNRLMRAMVRVVGYSMGLENMSVHSSREEAIAEARRVLDR